MAFLRTFLAAAVVLAACSVQAHHMGRVIPVGYSGQGAIPLAAHVIASYFEEQMGREMELSAENSIEKCIGSIIEKRAPMAVVPLQKAEDLPEAVVVVLPEINAGQGIITLIMGREAKKDLQFSLVPKYMEKLAEKLSPADWERGMARIDSGEGIRKVALDMLREGDLL